MIITPCKESSIYYYDIQTTTKSQIANREAQHHVKFLLEVNSLNVQFNYDETTVQAVKNVSLNYEKNIS